MYKWWSKPVPDVEQKNAKTIIHPFSLDLENPTGLTLNTYVGCGHRCAYCYATYKWSPEFYDKIIVRKNSAEVLHKQLNKWKTSEIDPVFLSSATDCYQPVEGAYQQTRKSIEVLQEHKIPYYILTKSSTILRDIDLHSRYRDHCFIGWSMTTINDHLKRRLEPGTSSTMSQLRAMKIMSDHEIVTGANIDPTIPGLTDNQRELEKLVRKISEAGGTFVSASVLLLRTDIWERMRNLFFELNRPDLISLYDKLYFTTKTHVRGYLAARKEYCEPLLSNIEETANKHGLHYGFPSGSMKTRQGLLKIDLKPRKLWHQESLGNCYLEQIDLPPSRSIETSN